LGVKIEIDNRLTTGGRALSYQPLLITTANARKMIAIIKAKPIITPKYAQTLLRRPSLLFWNKLQTEYIVKNMKAKKKPEILMPDQNQ